MAVYLGRGGYEVELYERRGDPRDASAQEGRSINLALSARALHALSEVGLAEPVLAGAVPMRGRMMHDVDGKLTFQPYGTKPEHVINSVSRGGLNVLLIEAAERLPGVRIHFSQRLVDVDLDSRRLIFKEHGT
jgi:kynurenine 3-monooxygenase